VGRADEQVDQAVARHNFDLAAEIPLRAGLFRVADDEPAGLQQRVRGVAREHSACRTRD
jgi:hypothetical protein